MSRIVFDRNVSWKLYEMNSMCTGRRPVDRVEADGQDDMQQAGC